MSIIICVSVVKLPISMCVSVTGQEYILGETRYVYQDKATWEEAHRKCER